jgi:GNAT superfamily N-acetyltransferase
MQQTLIDGGLIRKLWDVETHAYRDHLLRLDAESRRNRFCGGIADDTIRGYAATARGSDVIIHGFFVDGVLRGAADLHVVRPLDRREAEAAFSIEKAWQSHGVGSALLERTLLVARNRGIQHLQVCCLMENRRMQHLARKFESEITFDFGTVVGTMENSRPTPLSLMEEVVADGHSFAAACLDFQYRFFRPAGMEARLPHPRAAHIQ